MDASASVKYPWSPEVAARLRGLMIAFVVVLLLSMVTTIAYIAGRTSSAPAAPSRAQIMPANFSRAAPEPPQQHSPRPTEPPMPLPVPRQPVLAPKQTIRTATPAQNAPEPALENQESQEHSGTPILVPQPGQYLQVGAVDLASAKQMVRTLRNDGLAALVAPGPSDTIFRVVIGPFHSLETAAQASTALAGKGYRTFPRRY